MISQKRIWRSNAHPKEYTYLCINSKKDKDNKLFFGFEAEFDNYPHIDRNNVTLHEVLEHFNSNEFFVKEDFSCCIEINSSPFTWAYLKSHNPINVFKKYIKCLSVRRNCGFHIHVNREYFTKDHLDKLCKFIYSRENKDFLVKISNRGKYIGSFKQFAVLDSYYIDHSINEHYLAMSGNHKKTIEFRIFQGTNNLKLMQAYLEFLYTLLDFTKTNEYDDINIVNYKKYFNKRKKSYPYLSKLLDNKLKWNIL
jgi:hypothetical protein